MELFNFLICVKTMTAEQYLYFLWTSILFDSIQAFPPPNNYQMSNVMKELSYVKNRSPNSELEKKLTSNLVGNTSCILQYHQKKD